MNRIPGRTGTALLVVASAALAGFPMEGDAQDGLEDRHRLLEAVGAAIDEVKRSPFHRAGQAGSGFDPWTVGGTAWPFQANGAAYAIGSAPPSHQEAARADSSDAGSRLAGLAMVLGAAAGDLASLALGAKYDGLFWVSLLTLSPSLTAAATSLAGVSPGASFASSFLGQGLGVGTGVLTFKALQEPLDIAAIIPAMIVYYGVRFGVNIAAIRRLARRDRG